MNRTVDILGVEISNRTMRETINYIEEHMKTRKNAPFHIITANPEIVMQINRDVELKAIERKAGLVTADGVGILIASPILGDKISERVTGVELLTELLSMCESNGYSVFLLGSKEETSTKFEKYVTDSYPKLRISGRRNGYFHDSETNEIIDAINKSGTDLLVMAMGSPREHKWFNSVKDELRVSASIGVGGGMDSLSGVVKRAPMIVRKMNLEWLYRRFQDPSRAKRQTDLFRFMKLVLYKRLHIGRT